MHYYQHNIKSFNNATQHLTRVERSLYRDAIDLYYDTEKPLPAGDFARLARRLRANTDEELTALQFVLEEFFELDGDFWTHSKCDENIAIYHETASVKSKAGKASAAARKKKADEAKAAAANKKPTQNEQNPTGVKQALNECATNQEPRTNNQEPTTTGVVVTPPPKIPHHQSLIDNWQPSPATIEALTQLHRIPSQFISEQLVEFKTYWRDRADSKTSWDAAFLKRCPQQWKSYGAEWRRVADDEFLDKHTDKSWAEGL